MAWPLSSHFSTMLQTPQVAFRDPVFKKAEILRNAQGQPKPWSGAFAVVYKATLPTGEAKAVRVFSSESPERQERYEKTSQYLAGKNIACLVPFEYRENAIRSTDGKWYPMVVMDWVEGNTLFQWVGDQYARGNTTAVRVAADVWLDVVQELENAGIAHGDYQQSNIMVTPDGQMKLVDYDCMCVPELVGRRNLEMGVEPYQHPDRNGATRLSLTLDHFSSLMIYIALRALAADFGLWHRYIIDGNYDKFLFRKEDIQDSRNSRLIADLMYSPDMEVRSLTDLLLRCASGPMEMVPALWTVAGPFHQVLALLQAERWNDAIALLNQHQITNIPASVKGLVDRAYLEIWKSKAQSDFESLPLQEKSEKADRAICRVCNDVFLQQFPVSDAVRARIMEARTRVEKLDQLATLIRTSENGGDLGDERAIASMGEFFSSSYSYVQCPRVLKAQNAVEVIDAYIAALKKPIPNEIELADCWKAIKRSKCQAYLPEPLQQRAELATQRAPRVKILEEIDPQISPDQFDRRVQAAWDEQLLAGSLQAEQYRPLFETMQKRQVKLIQLSDAIEANQTQLIAELVTDPLLRNYPFSGSWGPFLRAKSEQWLHARGMLEAIDDGSPEAFVQQFDVHALTENGELFSEVRPKVRQWIFDYVLPRKSNGLKPVLGRASVLPEKKGVMLRWTWMPPRFGDTCWVGFSATNPLDTDRPEDIKLAFESKITRSQWEKTGSRLQLPTKREWNGLNVIVWGVIDCGDETYYTEPLVLGKLEVKHSWFPWGN